jgi:hypothetical protein
LPVRHSDAIGERVPTLFKGRAKPAPLHRN